MSDEDLTLEEILSNRVAEALREKGIHPDVKVFVEDSDVILSLMVFQGGRELEISTQFRFDGDMVLLRGLGKAADDLKARISSARHQGSLVMGMDNF